MYAYVDGNAAVFHITENTNSTLLWKKALIKNGSPQYEFVFV